MEYAKPEIAKLTPAVEAIQGSQNKGGQLAVDSPLQTRITSAAYEADE
ncbi:MAG: hypothetical protein L0338_25705 [Acidobacteria bacterium]|nr:hypothetical protein [Acidobacteriota bacterium]